ATSIAVRVGKRSSPGLGRPPAEDCFSKLLKSEEVVALPPRPTMT
ncbi:hypothetical protein LEMLEM_LOCUS8376, partial [Lemmus lemmus]